MTVIQVKATHLILMSDVVHDEISELYGVGELSDECAVTVASWWQSPGLEGRAFAALASGAPVDHLAVLADIWQAHGDATNDYDRRALDMLRDWTMARAREIEA